MRVVILGDIIGRPGRRHALRWIEELRSRDKVDFVVVNGENAAGGIGLTPNVAKEILGAGVDVITTGNHVWRDREMAGFLPSERRIVRPANYPQGVPGHGWTIVNRDALRLAILNLQGRVFMQPIDCPFMVADAAVDRIGSDADAIVVDFHAEATSEKQALGLYLDGRVSAVVGTHTHVQTSDARILPNGTGFITDLGMCGPINSVIGMDPETVIPKFITAMPSRFEVGKGPVVISGVMIEVDTSTGKTKDIQRFSEETDDTIR
ncbi:MAG: TIGR00282 family metallophosphoesterase [Bacillota bacterium]|nr:TIGR00282 family metallophosphoesterase [Bacillota bacterium]NLH86864.1 TIGR00282 family metallophosphoesterase [Bacillota bacterium]HAN86338.1 TIGR00282 family metallophosphoesterase [Bacillota bacterium]